jgi:hypothetical protein
MDTNLIILIIIVVVIFVILFMQSSTENFNTDKKMSGTISFNKNGQQVSHIIDNSSSGERVISRNININGNGNQSTSKSNMSGSSNNRDRVISGNININGNGNQSISESNSESSMNVFPLTGSEITKLREIIDMYNRLKKISTKF